LTDDALAALAAGLPRLEDLRLQVRAPLSEAAVLLVRRRLAHVPLHC
jgi:hypothetical protein